MYITSQTHTHNGTHIHNTNGANIPHKIGAVMIESMVSIFNKPIPHKLNWQSRTLQSAESSFDYKTFSNHCIIDASFYDPILTKIIPTILNSTRNIYLASS